MSGTKVMNIEEQKKKINASQPEINLTRPCRLNDGIIQHAEFEKNRFRVIFAQHFQPIHFFIPASGAGSRMFNFLYNFLENPDTEARSKTERFLNSIEEFAFFEMLPFEMKQRVREYNINLDDFISYIINEEGLGLGKIPKGLVPFHKSRSFILNAFQEQLLQGLNVKETPIKFHFTINKDHEKEIKNSLLAIRQLTGRDFTIEWSEQDPETHAIAFDEKGDAITDEKGDLLVRPSGHGALLQNLNAIDSEIIFVKNIDNIQHESHAKNAIENMQYLGGMMTVFKTELKKALESDDVRAALATLNLHYQFAEKDTLFAEYSEKEIHDLIYRPIRICGMVRNEGQPGGGPFWVESNGTASKQIVEKSQVGHNEEQYRLMVQSKYFNPVIMALSTKDIDGNKLDLNEFADFDKYFIVSKTHQGLPIRYIERPGLWNGSMANWLSVFVEVPSQIFTPVKNVLDLLSDPHKES